MGRISAHQARAVTLATAALAVLFIAVPGPATTGASSASSRPAVTTTAAAAQPAPADTGYDTNWG